MSNEVLVKQGNKAEWVKDDTEIDPKRLPTEEWTFTLEDGSTVTKKVAVGE